MEKSISATGTPQPDRPAAAGKPPQEFSAAPPGEASRQEKLVRELLQSDQDIQESGHAIQLSDQAILDSDQAILESSLAIQDFDQDIQDAGQAIQEAGRQLRKADQALRQSDLTFRTSDQTLRTSDKALRDSDQTLRATDRALRTSNRTLTECEEYFRLLEESEERFRLLVESVTDYAIYMLDPEGRVVTWNVGAERSKGYTAEEVLGRNYSIFFLPEDVEAGTPAKELAAAAREGSYETRTWQLRKDGSKFWALVTLTAIRGPEDVLLGFAKVTRDMTAQKLEEKLRNLNTQLERYRVIVDNVGEYVLCTLDAHGRIDSWSPSSQKLLGFAPEEVLGRHYSMNFTPAEIEAGEPRRELEEAARTGHCATERWRVRRDGSLFWSSGVLTAVRDESGMLTGYIRVARDMTAQKRMAEQLAQLAASLEKRVAERTRELEVAIAELQRKNQEIESFVYIVSHDLRAPLVNVQGFAHELKESCERLGNLAKGWPLPQQDRNTLKEIQDEEIGGALRYISTSTSKFERLINALLGLSRHGCQVYDLTRVNVWELVTTAVATFQMALTEAGAEVEVGQLPSVTADATALGQVFSNLIGNALKYRNPERPLRIEVGGQEEGGVVNYWVRDNGLGLPESAKARLFQVFQRFHPGRAEGEGMGLTIVRRIVERHGGKIWAESQEGEGSTFHLTLPSVPMSPSPVGTP